MLLASDYDKTRFLKAADLDRDKKFRIKSVTPEEVGIGRDKETKLVVWFTNDARGLVLNKTNNRTLRGAFGDDTAGWTAKVIVVFPTMVDVRGRMEPALRVRIPSPKQAAAAAPSGNGAAAPSPAVAPTVVDPELADDPKLSVAEEMDDGIPEKW
jgi:hypothetical protein